MEKKFLNISLLIATLVIVCISCNKDDDNSEPSNPFNGKTSAVFNPNVTYGTLTDQDGNTYKTVTIGTQIWMAENLRTTKYNDGTAIPNVTDDAKWADLSSSAFCNYTNTTNFDTIATYGRLYNWYAVNTGKLAPKGWHVPSDAEWTELTDYLGGTSVDGGKMKEIGTTHWYSPNTGATNESGFTALPGGSRSFEGNFSRISYYGAWLSASESNTNNFWSRYLLYDFSDVNRYGYFKGFGISVRCVRD